MWIIRNFMEGKNMLKCVIASYTGCLKKRGAKNIA